MKLIPIYTENIKNRRNHTIFLDKKKRTTYKAFHKEEKINHTYYWIGFFIVIAIMRGIESIQLHIPTAVSFGKIGIGVILGMWADRVFYQKYIYEEMKEIYLTESMIEQYIDQGRKLFQFEIGIVVGCFLVFLVLALVFILDQSLVVLIFSLFFFVIFSAYVYRMPMARMKLYRKNNRERT
ncbi:hypothetical protein MUN88_10860 [Gracilibacillus caseinilyticus]|uniref:Uncharacterized protein n=1 Tax=Gracilibacillus caseinilyticus TaxID=2932256 RepID=A0ABY4ESA1_9BACI|nr:hypothetical protein [Gracilibacillus caseinilyticus]UOQ46607.1 hypothetical protein MUN88_10860 [Gracilibacillus caseinilyticus]